MCYLRRIAKIQFFAGISDLTDIAAEEKQKIVILRLLDKIWPASRQDIGSFDL